MNIVIGLLGIIAVSEVSRLLMTHRATTKKMHFKQKLDGVKKMVWDMQFKKFKTSEIREDVRKEYDMMKARIDALDTQIKTWPKEKPEGDRKRLEDDRVRADVDVKRFEQQIKELDVQIAGSKRTNEYPEGVQGITQDIEGLMELESMLRDWLKRI
jgi:hypothetical protein